MKFQTLMLMAALLLVAVTTPPLTIAQNQDNSTPTDIQGNTPQGAPTTGNPTNTGFDTRWLIPIVGIPLLLLLGRVLGADTSIDQDQTGMKGGRTRRRTDHMEHDRDMTDDESM